MSVNTDARRLQCAQIQPNFLTVSMCKWIRFQSDEAMNNSTVKEEILTSVPLKTTTVAVDIHEAMMPYSTGEVGVKPLHEPYFPHIIIS